MVANMRASSNGDPRPASSKGSSLIIKRWDGASRLSTQWDSLRRDPELWIESGDCIVHLAPQGLSRRGPSFLVPLVALRGTKLATQARPIDLERRQPWDEEGTFARLQSRIREDDDNHKISELFLPAPEDCTTKEQILDWHLTTRNYFAFVLRKSLVGRSLGRSFITLQGRLDLWRPHHRDNLDDLLAYARLVGYMAFAHCPDYALAMLSLAEQNRLDDLWVDAFAHCVGMEDMLHISNEHENVSKPTKAYIKNYAISMGGRLQRATKSLSCFLEDDFSPAYLGINDAARTHLNQFQQFLREFYSQKFGRWPPRTLFSKSIFKSMHSDFSNLYDYLVDLESSPDITEQGLASGGICVLQVVQAFDQRNTYEALDNPLCLLPIDGDIRRSSSKKALVALGLGDKQEINPAANVLTKASNSNNEKALSSPLVKAFRLFESHSLKEHRERLPLSDARKIRWLLVYCTLQVLTSVMQTPLAVCDTDTNYPLCCDTHGLPPWIEPPLISDEYSRPASSGRDLQSSTFVGDGVRTMPPSRHESTRPMSKKSRGPQSDISPDCQQDDYIKHMEIPIPTWKDVLSMRDPSTVAIKKMKKRMDSDSSNANKGKGTKTAEKKPSRYSFNILSSKKSATNFHSTSKQQELEKQAQRKQARNTMGPSDAPPLIPQPPAPMTRHTSSSTGGARSSSHSGTSIKSDAATAVPMPNRVDSTRTAPPPTRSKSTLGKSPGSDLLHQVLNGSSAPSSPVYAEPKSPTKAQVAPWEAMEPTMSGAIDSGRSDDDASPAPAGASRSASVAGPSGSRNGKSGKGKELQQQQQSHTRMKSVPLVPP